MKGEGIEGGGQSNNKTTTTKRKKKESRLGSWGVQRQQGLEGCQGLDSCILYLSKLYVIYNSFLLTIKRMLAFFCVFRLKCKSVTIKC